MADQIRPIVGGYAEEQFKFDAFAHAVTVIQEQHRFVHDGMYFQTSGKQTGWLDGTTKTFLLRTAADNYPHVQAMRLSFGRGDVDFVAYEGATISATGAALPVVNVNRTSTKTPAMTLFAEPTATDNGGHIFTLWVPNTAAGQSKSADGVSGIGQASEWVLKPGTDYLVVMTNNSGGTIAWSYEFAWYEISYVYNVRKSTDDA